MRNISYSAGFPYAQSTCFDRTDQTPTVLSQKTQAPSRNLKASLSRECCVSRSDESPCASTVSERSPIRTRDYRASESAIQKTAQNEAQDDNSPVREKNAPVKIHTQREKFHAVGVRIFHFLGTKTISSGEYLSPCRLPFTSTISASVFSPPGTVSGSGCF